MGLEFSGLREKIRPSSSLRTLRHALALMASLIGADVHADTSHHGKTERPSAARIADDVAAINIPDLLSRSIRESENTFKAFLRKFPNPLTHADHKVRDTMFELMSAVSNEVIRGTSFEKIDASAGTYVFSDERKGHGNGVVLVFNDWKEQSEGPRIRMRRYVLVTVKHVADLFPLPAGDWTHHREGLDVSAVELSEEEALPYRPLFLDQKSRDRNVVGELVVARGVDTDGTKRFAALLGPREEDSDKQYLIAIPDDETVEDARQNMPLMGMSGSQVVTQPESAAGPHFVGMIATGLRAHANGKEISCAGIVSAEAVWQVIDDLPAFESRKAERTPEEASGWTTHVEGQR